MRKDANRQPHFRSQVIITNRCRAHESSGNYVKVRATINLQIISRNLSDWNHWRSRSGGDSQFRPQNVAEGKGSSQGPLGGLQISLALQHANTCRSGKTSPFGSGVSTTNRFSFLSRQYKTRGVTGSCIAYAPCLGGTCLKRRDSLKSAWLSVECGRRISEITSCMSSIWVPI